MMKKAIIAGCLAAGLFLVAYFVCRDSSTETKGASSSLLTESLDTQHSRNMTTTERDEPIAVEEGEGASEEAGKETEKAAENTVVFTLRGEANQRVFRSVNPFKKLKGGEVSGYVANFAENIKGVTVTNQDTYRNIFSLLLPHEVTPGTYTEASANFIVQFFGDQAGELFHLDAACPFKLTVTEWGGPGGRARGYFSGELKSDDTDRIISLSGSFDIGIEQ